ncbi:MAG: haloacid dehalogenase type II [Propionibacteriaceae bacterium]
MIANASSLGDITTLVFDVMGTVVDDDGPIRRVATEVLTRAAVEPALVPQLVQDWLDRHAELLAEVVSGADWSSHDDLRAAALDDVWAAAGLRELPATTRDELTGVIHRLDPWPDSPAALTALRSHYTVVALSNADVAELTGLSAYGGLSWHCALSGQLAHAYKPQPAVYRLALDLLGVDPARILMVAAHPWDLRAAAEHGMRTAFVDRPGSTAPASDDTFDLEVDDLAGLVTELTRTA